MPDSTAIDREVCRLLGADSVLLTLMPNGVYQDEAPAWATRFVIVSKQEATHVGKFNGTAWEDVLYLVEPHALRGSGGDVDAAANRIKALLDERPLTVTGYTWMTTYCEGRATTPRTERTGEDESVQWQRQGALYRVQMSI